MAEFKIITDSTADLPEEYMAEHDIACMNLCYMIGGETYGGETGKELPWKEFYARMRKGEMPTTAQVNPEEAKKNFLKLIEAGNKKILHLSFSSGLSGTYNSVRIAAEEIMEENAGCQIIVVDTLCASLGEGLLVHYAVKMRDEGKSLEETAKWVEEHIQNFVHVFTVDDLHHLHRGGRVSKAVAVLGTMAGIKPVLHVDEEGHLVFQSTTRGRKKSLLKLVDNMEKQMGTYTGKNDIVFISHGDALEEAEFVREEVRKRFGISEFIINRVGPTIGAHAGPGVIALFFMGDVR